ncbi:hypothetical protein KIL84_008445 [Mauremys mutica]|uniref:Uncharacterized protein n=1 Tax=Mauremys mutica TaxID=74926 RepID=A0A9D3X6B1_9SAUR|nr:hypothetical protein KIL84_008445 [Mauremys mutica]
MRNGKADALFCKVEALALEEERSITMLKASNSVNRIIVSCVTSSISDDPFPTQTLNDAASPVQIDDYVPTNIERVTYLGSTISQDGGTSQDIRNKISKAKNTFRSLNTIWKSSKYNTKTKLKI